MTSIFTSISKSVGHSVHLVQLDYIVNDLLKQHEKEMQNLINSREDPFTEVEAVTIEAAWALRFNGAYDKRAMEVTGTKIPDNWTDDKELICVRKRILNRGLEKHTGKLPFMFEEHMHATIKLIREVLAKANKSLKDFSDHIATKFPMKDSDLEAQFGCIRGSILSKAKQSIPNILELSPKYSNNPELSWNLFWANKITAAENTARDHNTHSVAQFAFLLKQRKMEKLAQQITELIAQNEAEFQDEMIYVVDTPHTPNTPPNGTTVRVPQLGVNVHIPKNGPVTIGNGQPSPSAPPAHGTAAAHAQQQRAAAAASHHHPTPAGTVPTPAPVKRPRNVFTEKQLRDYQLDFTTTSMDIRRKIMAVLEKEQKH